jgi:AraC family transcriptional regulator
MSRSFVPVAANATRDPLRTAGFSLTEARYGGNRRRPLHAHRNPVLVFVLEGAFSERIGRQVHDCGHRSLLSIPAEQTHAETFTAPETHGLVLEVGPERADSLGPFESVLTDAVVFDVPPIASIGLELYREYRHRDDATPLAVEGLVLTLAAAASRKIGTARERHRPPWLERVRAAMHDRFRDSLRMPDLAAEASVHPVYLARAFRRHFGCSPAAYLRRLRVEAAQAALLRTEAPLTRVALEAGFADQSHLTHQFRRLVGTSPARYRHERRSA